MSAALRLDVHARVGDLELRVALEHSQGILVVLGPNGAGKSSLLRAILGALPIERGRISVRETLLCDTSTGIDVPIELRRLGYVPQRYALFPHLSVRENLRFAAHSQAAPSADSERRIARVLAELQLEGLVERRPLTLSGGEQQRVALARALSIEPRALLLDEPLAALDVHARTETRVFLGRYLRALRVPVVLVTHDAQDARTLGDHIVVLERGRGVQSGSWSDLARAPASSFLAALVASASAS